MRKSFLILAFIILCAAPTIVFAQGFGGGLSAGFPSLPFLPSLGGTLGARSSCGPGEPVPGIAPAFYVGWLDHRKGITFDYDFRIAGNEDFHERLQTPFKGLWLGFELESAVSDRLALSIGGGWLIPGKMDGAVRSDGLRIPFDSRPEYWFLEGMVALNPGGAFQVIGGFRWDHYTSEFDVHVAPQLGDLDAYQDIRVELYLPFLGVQCAGPPLTARMIFFPYVPGNIKSVLAFPDIPEAEEFTAGFSEGYFFEIFAEYSQRMFGQAAIGAFVRWNLLHARATADLDLVPTGRPAELTMVFDKRSWTLGGSFSLDFNLL